MPRQRTSESDTAVSSRATLTERAYSAIKSAIISNELLPGQVVTETELTAQLSVGKTPVREALVRLHSEGLVQPRPRKGYVITPLTLRHARELFHVRKILETDAARLAAERGCDTEALESLDELCKIEVDSADARSVAAFLERNAALHIGISAAGGNTVLTALLREVIEQLDRYIHFGVMMSKRSGTQAHEHSELIEAIRARDAAQAAKLAHEQVAWTESMILDALTSTPSIQSASLQISDAD